MRSPAAAAVVAAVLLAPGPAARAAAQDAPSASVERAEANPGESVEVTGRSWPDASVVQSQLCGNEALNGSVDCDRAGAVTIGVASDGQFSVELPVTTPPTPCPCVVLVTSPDVIGTVLRLPMEVIGAPTAEAKQDRASVPLFAITHLRVAKQEPVAALFGLGHDRSVVMTVENVGATAIDTLPITIADASEPDEVIGSGEVHDLQPGEASEVTLDFPVDVLARGSITVNVVVDGAGQAMASSTSFSTFPWALLAIVAVLLLLTAVLVGLRRRRRLRRDDLVEASGESKPEAEPKIDLGLAEIDLHADPSNTVAKTWIAASRGSDRALSDDLARLIAIALGDIGSVPPTADTDALAESMAHIVVSELRNRHDFDPSAALALTASITDELARELRQVVGSAP